MEGGWGQTGAPLGHKAWNKRELLTLDRYCTDRIKALANVNGLAETAHIQESESEPKIRWILISQVFQDIIPC